MAAGGRLYTDMAAVHFAAGLRLALVLVVVSVGSYGQHSAPARTLLVLLGLGSIPWATVVLFAAERPGNWWAVIGGPAGDTLALFAVHALIPETAPGVLLGYLVVVAFTAYTAGRAVAGPLAALSVAFAMGVAALRSGADDLAPGTLLAFSAALLALVYLVDRTVALQMRASARSTRLEGKADAILARVADCVVVTDARGNVLQCNPAAERLIGLPSDVITGRPCSQALAMWLGDAPLDCDRSCALLALSGAPGAGEPDEIWRFDAAGRKQPLLANAEAVTDDRGHTVEVVHSLRDISRLKQAEEAKTLFLATASHELKTPLTVIRGFADTLLTFDDFEPERRTAALEAIRIRSEELVRIVDRLLLSSRIEAGRVQVNVTRLAIAPLLMERVRALQAATGRDIDIDVDPVLPEVCGDGQALTTVIDHLLDNALKYSPGGEPVIVRCRPHADAVRIDVTDGGVGMDAEQAERCFDKFWQAEATDVRRFGGTGIGLYIVRSLVEAMGGIVTVASAPGEGSTFSLWLFDRETAAGVRDGRELGEATSIREFMRQIGVPERSPL